MFSLNRLGAGIAGRFGFLDIYSVVRRALVRSQIAIIMYHSVTSAPIPWVSHASKPEEAFEREIAYLSRIAEILPLEWLVDRLHKGESIPRRAVGITFDDGYKDNYTIAYPILRKYNAAATIFLITGCIGGSDIFWWSKVGSALMNTSVDRLEVEGLRHYDLKSNADRLRAVCEILGYLERLPSKERDPLIERLLKGLRFEPPDNLWEKVALSWDEVLEMSQNGISFGAHTVTHPALSRLSIEEARKEISLSKSDIEQRLGKPCSLFAYPNSDFNTGTVELVRESGFAAAVTTVPRLLDKQPKDLLLLPRISSGSTFYTFKGSYSGLYPDLMTVASWFNRGASSASDRSH